MDQGWDHTENEDKHLLAHTLVLNEVNDTQVAIKSPNTTGSIGGGGCSSGSQELVSLSGESTKQLFSILFNHFNQYHYISLYNFKFPLLIYYTHQLNCLYSSICEICNICNSTSKCTCNCQCTGKCTGNTICLCLCTNTKGTGDKCCICICKKDDKCKCICICVCENGEKCCCQSGTAHTCKECLVKVDMSKLNFQASIIIDQLFYVKCSLQSLSTHLINTYISTLGVVDIGLDNTIIINYSMMNVGDYELVVNRLHDSAKKIDQILQLVPLDQDCRCILRFERSTNNSIIIQNVYLYNILDKMTNKSKDEFVELLGLDKISKIHELGMTGNHMCLCMVIKYILYPQIINLFYIMKVDLDTLSTLSRKFRKYNDWTQFRHDIPQLLLLLIDILDSISKWIRKNYTYAMRAHRDGVDIICFCTYNEDSNYHPILNLMLVLSSLVENIWAMDTESVRMSIESISWLYSQLESYDFNSTSLKPVSCSRVYSLLVKKECKDKPDGKCCCCFCVTAFNLALILIFLCIQCKLCKAISKNSGSICEKVKDFCKVEECKCTCAQKGNSACCLLKLALCAQPTSAKDDCQDLKKALENCCPTCQAGKEGCCCKTLAEKIQQGLCKLLLLGCECNCTTTGGTTQEVKAKCVMFNDLNGCTRVAVVIFCKCADPTKPCCCLYQLVDSLKTKLGGSLDKICQEGQCVCDKLKTICEEICGQGCVDECPSGCVCTKLKEELANICKGTGGNCLCKELKERLSNLCKKPTCPCSKPNEKGCCKCVCCKLLRESVRILVRACRANVLEPHKRIVVDLIGSSKDKQIVKSILERINRGTVNKISLVKNSYSSYPGSIGSDMGVKDASTGNWGYDTVYEHRSTMSNSHSENEIIKIVYPASEKYILYLYKLDL